MAARMKLIPCTHELHAQPILALLNEAIANSTALYDYQPRTLDMPAQPVDG
jgi:phosphinothricin acetyltransferase